MTLTQALIAYALAAGLLTVTPGLDTALILRTAAVEGPRRAAGAAIGISVGCLIWGAAAALGLGVLLAASHLAYNVRTWAGAAYLAYLGVKLLVRPRARFDAGAAAADGETAKAGGSWLVRGLTTNLLNPKIGVFYVSFLPQFVPTGAPTAPFIMLLAGLHVLMGLVWAGGLIAATQPLGRALRRPAVVRSLDRLTGVVFLGFAARLALDRR